LGNRKIGSLKITDVEYLIAALTRKMKPSSVRSVSAVLHQMCGAAVREGRLASNPCIGVKLPPREHKPLELLEPAEVSLIADVIRPDLEVAVWLGAGAGLRVSETLGLTMARIDFLRRRGIRVEQQLQRGQLAELKTRASARWVPVDNMVITKIAQHLERWPSDGFLITNRGRLMPRQTFAGHWSAAVRAAGLPPTNYHSLRHFYASALIRAGLSVKEVQSRLGHTSAMITLDTYGHLFGDEEERGRGAVEAMFLPAPGQAAR
jgi:integrase